MTANEIVTELKKLASPSVREVLVKHGAPATHLGVKIGDMKPIVKKVKMNHELAMELFDTGISDAMYLAGLISDSKKMTKKELQHWVENSQWHMIGEFSVPWTVCESPFAVELANKWIKSKDELIACSGWCTYSCYISITPNEKLDYKEIKVYIDHIEKNLQSAPNRVRYNMNNFLIAAGGYIPEFREAAINAAAKIGKFEVNLGDNACKIPEVKPYIQRMIERGSYEKKKKTARC